MVVDQLEPDTASRVFAALGDPTRRDILARVLHHQTSVSALASSYAMSFAAVQKHVAVLESAGLVSKKQQGRERLVRGDLAGVRAAKGLLEEYEDIWRGRIGRIEEILAEPGAGEAT